MKLCGHTPVPLLVLLLLLTMPGVALSTTTRVVVGDLVLEAPVELAGELHRLAEVARETVPHLERDLGVRARGPYRIVLLPAGRIRDSELERIDALAPPWAAGFLVGPLRLGAVRMGEVRRYPYDSADEVLAHEIVHLLLYDAARHPLPAWFSEGVATWEGRRRGIRGLVSGASAILARDAPRLDAIDAQFRAGPASARRAYAASLDFVAWNVRRHGTELVPELLTQLQEHTLEDAWLTAAGESLADSERQWRRRSVWLRRWLPLLGSTSVLWLAITLLAVLAGLARRRRDRVLRERWDAEDQRAYATTPGGDGGA